jgi:LacI family transcriptional regulator
MTDVARLAGLSQTTVSLVLNEVATVSIPEETRGRVWAAVKELGYRPNAAAKMLRTNRTHTLGFVTDEIATTPFAGKILEGAQDLALANDKILLTINTGRNTQVEKKAIEMLLERQVEGIIYATMYHREVTLPYDLGDVPVVLLDCFVANRSLPSVVPDEITGGRLATETLLSKGHRRIGFINLPYNYPAPIGRLKGYREALEANGITYDPALVRPSTGYADGGYQETLALMKLSEPPTALFCATDRMAMGAYDALRELGRRIPQDVAVIGFDNQEIIAPYLRPALSTMGLPHYEMGHWAVQYLLDQAEHTENTSSVQQLLPCPLIERESI